MPKRRTTKARFTAKLEAGAKASYSRKRTITEVIPPDVTRAKSGAWLDLISPLTEWAGLKGDQLRLKRAQLRLQREDILEEIVKRAREKIEKTETHSVIPNKFLVPFLEHASLESADSFLVNMWANLLASAAKGFKSHHVHFVSIISQLSARQGEILEQLIGTENERALDLARDNISTHFGASRIRRSIRELLNKPKQSVEEVSAALEDLFDHVGIELVYIGVEERRTEDYYDINGNAYRDEAEVDYSILEAVGLIRRVETDFFSAGDWSIMATYYYLTDLGFHFARACGLVSELRSSDV